MIFLFGGAVLGIIFAFVMVSPMYDFSDFIALFIGILLFGFAGLLAGGALGALVGYFLPQEFKENQRIELVALKNKDLADGHFFLGSGQIKEEIYYAYYRKFGEGYKADKINVNDAIVFEDEKESPYLKTYEADFTRQIYFILGLPMRSKDAEFHIPPGSIVRNINLDL